jgi:ABC-type branched-subunit amino acid transport system ATPase component
MSACLDVTGLVAGYERSNPIVRGASLSVAPGQIVTLIGPNGAGKSTCVRAIAGLVPIEAGHIQLNGQDITTFPAHGRVATGLGFVPRKREHLCGPEYRGKPGAGYAARSKPRRTCPGGGLARVCAGVS